MQSSYELGACQLFQTLGNSHGSDRTWDCKIFRRFLFCFGWIPMLCAVQPRAVRLDCIEEQNAPGAVAAGVRHYRDRVARFIGCPSPSPTDHEVDARSLDVPRVVPNRDDDVAVRVLPPILLDDASIRHIP